MGFLKDLEEGKEFEHRVLAIVRQNYPSEKWVCNPIKKWVDIVSSGGKTIEVKYDRMAQKTWNFFIEVECNGKPSWINAYDNIDVLAYWIEGVVYLFNIAKLKEAISIQKFRTIKGWDWWRVTWVLIPIPIGITISSKIIHYDPNN